MINPEALAILRELGSKRLLTPHRVVDQARDPESPLHRYFQWEDAPAADAWRLEQARRLIRENKITVMVEHRIVRVHEFVRDSRCASLEAGYAPTVEVRLNAMQARDTMLYELRRAASILNRASALGQVLGVSKQLAEAIRDIRALSDSLRMDAAPPSAEAI